jgi:hypothetical protein
MRLGLGFLSGGARERRTWELDKKVQRDPANNELIDPVLLNGPGDIVSENNLPNDIMHKV